MVVEGRFPNEHPLISEALGVKGASPSVEDLYTRVTELENTLRRVLPRYLESRFVSPAQPVDGQVYKWDASIPRFVPATAAVVVQSGTFAIDSTGIKTVTIAHGMATVPSIQKCFLTVHEQTDVDDWAYNLLKVDSVDGTNVTAKINVSTASATGGATARLALLVWGL